MWLQFINDPYSEAVTQYTKEIPAKAEARDVFTKVNSSCYQIRMATERIVHL